MAIKIQIWIRARRANNKALLRNTGLLNRDHLPNKALRDRISMIQYKRMQLTNSRVANPQRVKQWTENIDPNNNQDLLNTKITIIKWIKNNRNQEVSISIRKWLLGKFLLRKEDRSRESKGKWIWSEKKAPWNPTQALIQEKATRKEKRLKLRILIRV